MFQPKVSQVADLSGNPAFQALLADHHFRKTVDSSKIQDLIQSEFTQYPLKSGVEVPLAYVHTPIKAKPGSVQDL